MLVDTRQSSPMRNGLPPWVKAQPSSAFLAAMSLAGPGLPTLALQQSRQLIWSRSAVTACWPVHLMLPSPASTRVKRPPRSPSRCAVDAPFATRQHRRYLLYCVMICAPSNASCASAISSPIFGFDPIGERYVARRHPPSYDTNHIRPT